jgi:small subunit ribosomal protein S14
MATKAWISKQKRREELVKRYADVRRKLKKEKNYAAIAKLPRDSSPTRSHNRCQLTGPELGGAAEVQDQPDHAPGARPGGEDPGVEEGELVKKEVAGCELLVASSRSYQQLVTSN